MRRYVAMLAALALMTTVGCARMRNAIHSTMEDAGDIARVDVSGAAGTDMGAHVMVTQYAQLKGYSCEDLYRAGINARSIGIWKDERNDWWIGPYHPRNMRIDSDSVATLSYGLAGKAKGGWFSTMELAAESPDEVGFGFHPILVGVRVGVRPLEFVDLLTTLVGYDLLGDNLTWRQRQMMSGNIPSGPRTPEEMRKRMRDMHEHMREMRKKMREIHPDMPRDRWHPGPPRDDSAE